MESGEGDYRQMNLKQPIYDLYGKLRQIYRMKKGQRFSWQNEKISVVFLMQYAPSWGKLELLYESLLENPLFDVHLVCVPEELSDKENATFCYFSEKGYEAINACMENGSWFDIKTLKPDYVFTTRPYDFYLPVEYQSHNMCTYTRLCNFSYGINLDKELADMIFGQNSYMHTYMYFVEMESLVQEYQKAQRLGHKLGLIHSACMGMIAIDGFMKEVGKESPSWEFADAGLKVIWAPRWTTDKKLGGSNFFTYKDFMLDYFRENEDMNLLMRPHPLMFDNFIRTGEMTEAEVAEYKDKVQNAKNICFDMEKEYAHTFWQSDVLIADYSSIIPEYFLTEKPLIFCITNMELTLLDNMKDILKGCYVVDSKEELQDCLEMLRRGQDPKETIRKEMKQKLFGDTLGKSVELTTNWLIEDWRSHNAGN